MRRFRLFSVWNMVFLMAIVVLFLLVVYPMGSIFQASLLSADTGEFTWDNYLSVFTTKFYRRCLWNSFFLSALATVFSVIIGVPFAFLTTRYKLPHASILKTLGTLPLILPTFIGAEAWLLLLGRNGILTQFFHSIAPNTTGTLSTGALRGGEWLRRHSPCGRSPTFLVELRSRVWVQICRSVNVVCQNYKTVYESIRKQFYNSVGTR